MAVGWALARLGVRVGRIPTSLCLAAEGGEAEGSGGREPSMGHIGPG